MNEKVIGKLLNIWGLILKRKIKRPKKSWISKILDFLEKRANLLWQMIRENKIRNCFQVLVSDVTEFYYAGGKKAYLSVHLDYFGKMIYGWHLSMNPNSDLVKKSFKNAIKRLIGFGINKFKRIIMHQDRGSIYTSNDYTATVLSTGMYLSYSRTGAPGDNAVNESFFSRLKAEWLDIFSEAKDFDDLKRLVKRAIDYYNQDRYHSSIGNETPLFFTKQQLTCLMQN